uniref:Uncharacterized protein n=1 Tax=Avena sativa TaxID=4498 RepID=A0ACD6AKA7_AVESA
MAASPEFFQPAYTPRLFVATAAGSADQDDSYYHCHTPRGAEISFLGKPATCPPAPMKPRPPPASACRKRLFAAAAARDIAKLNFDDLEAMFRPAPLSDGKKQLRRRRSTRRSVVGAAFVAN